MIVAAEAYDILNKTNPKTIQKFIALMKAHPQWEKFQKIIGTVPTEDRDRYLFMVAARWPDDVKSGTDGRQYDRKPWHYVDFPIVFPADRGKVTPEAPDKENALTAFGAKAKVIKNGERADAQAIALCWIVHLTGDLHQPLHTCSLFSAQYPEGDRGGNLSIVRVQEGRAAYALHTLWDGLMTSSERYQTSAKIAVELLARPEFQRAQLPGVDDPKPYDWAWESYRVAVRSVYLDGKLKTGTDKKDKEGAPILPAGYMQDAKAAAERQIVVAGYRLADQLVDLLGR